MQKPSLGNWMGHNSLLKHWRQNVNLILRIDAIQSFIAMYHTLRNHNNYIFFLETEIQVLQNLNFPLLRIWGAHQNWITFKLFMIPYFSIKIVVIEYLSLRVRVASLVPCSEGVGVRIYSSMREGSEKNRNILLCYLYYYMKNFCNLIGLEQWYFSLIWNTLHVKITNLLRVVV